MTSYRRARSRAAASVAVTSIVCGAALTGAISGASAASAAAGSAGSAVRLPAGYHATVFASAPGKATGPDDITKLGDHLFVAYQNGVGSMGEPSSSGKTKSTIVEYTQHGQVVASWNVTGKVDGLGADPRHHRVIATVNEDGNSSLYTVTPDRHAPGDADDVKHYTYTKNPLPHGGGTDSVVVRDGVIFITASAPAADANGTTFSRPALYTADIDNGTVALTPVLHDNSTATDAVTGKKATLNLSDPDSSEVVPHAAPRFGGDLLLDSQGDGQLIFLRDPGHAHQQATVLNLSTQVDDSAFATGDDATLYVVDSGKNEILAITGPFHHGEMFASVPSDSTVAPGNLATVNTTTGAVTPFGSGFTNPKGLLFAFDDEN